MTSQKEREYAKQWRDKNRAKCAEYSARYAKKNPEYKKQWNANNKHRLKKYSKAWLSKNKGHAKIWRMENPEKTKGYAKKWNNKNRKEISAKEKAKYWSDIEFRMRKILRSRFRLALVHGLGKKIGSSIELIGCDVKFLMGYIEARFKPGMKWSNYGEVWEIDHRVPCVSFDLTDESHQRSCFHYSNLQPLFILENRTKKDALPASHQAELI